MVHSSTDWLAALLVQHDTGPERQNDQRSHDDADCCDPNAGVEVLRVDHDPPDQVLKLNKPKKSRNKQQQTSYAKTTQKWRRKPTFLLHVGRGGRRDGHHFTGPQRVVGPDPELVRRVRDQVIDFQLTLSFQLFKRQTNS